MSKVDFKKILIKDLKISDEIITQLHLSGIDNLEDLNGFNLTQLRKYVFREDEEQFNELMNVLKKHTIPSEVANLSLSRELTYVLAENQIVLTKDLFTIPRTVYNSITHDDEIFKQEINQLFTLYGVELEEEKEDIIDVGAFVSAQAARKPKVLGSRVYSHFKIRLASPDEIRAWSYGEVLKHETINYRTLKPEVDGLFCERIFGPTKDYQCACGKKRNLDKGQICEKCGVEITESKVRRERMGHIELEAPVVHTWFLKNSPSRLALLLDVKAKDLEEIVYLASYIVTNPGNPGETELTRKQILSEMEYSQYYERYGNRFTAMTGAEAVKKLLQDLDLEKEVRALKRKLKSPSKQKRDRAARRLEVVQAFKESDNKPEWMVLDVLPVIPPDLRPMVQLEGARFATTDLNDLYRRILNRNNRLKKQKEQFVPRLIIKNEKRLLQEAVDALIDNTKRGRRSNTDRNRPLKSLSDMLRGKQGRFRQNLLGKRVDFSARSVIIVGPDLEMYQCGIPREMAMTLFKPFVIKELQERLGSVQEAKRSYELANDDAWSALEDIVVEHPVLLNRAPTLHRLGIQAFEPKLIEGKAIRLHPLVTPAFNADFDGDQMAVHLPLSHEAQAEARLLMLASNNILNPKNGKPVVTPSQDMVLGNYYLTLAKKGQVNDKGVYEGLKNEGNVYTGLKEAYMAYKNHEITLHTLIVLEPETIDSTFTEEQKDKYFVTTLGRLIFNEILPSSFPFLNEPTDKNLYEQVEDKFFINKGQNLKEAIEKLEPPKAFNYQFLSKIVAEVFKMFEINETSKLLDKLKDLGFKYSTVSGISISMDDMQVYTGKKERVAQSEKVIKELDEYLEDGLITLAERKRLAADEWKVAVKDIEQGVMAEFKKDNHIYMIYESGARGKTSNFSQVLGMRGQMVSPSGETIEIPVKANFKEGLTVSEFFISTHGARKGSTDTALKTAESGYLTRKLVDVSQGVIVDMDDCKTDKGLLMEAIYTRDDNKLIMTLSERIIGRYTNQAVINPKTEEVIIDANQLITFDHAEAIEKAGITQVDIRSTLTCDSLVGVCAKCYGLNLATNKPVEVGEAVGVIAAQSIGEPGTQLTMRTFHTGGVASQSDITAGLPRVQELLEARKPKGRATISEVNGVVERIENRQTGITITIKADQLDENEEAKQYKYVLDPSASVLIKKGERIKAGQRLNKGAIHPKELLRVTSKKEVERYIIEEVQVVYKLIAGEAISDKHIEIIVRQMLRMVNVIYEGETDLLPGSRISIVDFKRANDKAIAEGLHPAVGQPELLGIARASLSSDSVLSAASFQETTRVLTDAAIHGKTDELRGLKENVIIGGLIPAGTGILKDRLFEYEEPIYQDYDEEQ